MSKRLVAYFSASGVTAGLARNLAKAAKADLFEIEPVPRYTSADLDWHDSRSRSSLEMKDPASRPPVRAKVDDMAQYDTTWRPATRLSGSASVESLREWVESLKL